MEEEVTRMRKGLEGKVANFTYVKDCLNTD